MAKYELLKELIDLVEDFESINSEKHYTSNLDGFREWLKDGMTVKSVLPEPTWEGKEMNRSPESVINTLLVHLNRYAKTYSKSAIYNSDFSTQEDFIYLINLKAFGSMTKMELIKKNIQEKPVGMQIINRLINQGWVAQQDSELDKRSKIIDITTSGLTALENQMDKIRNATTIVAGNLTYNEKMELIHLLKKLDAFHKPIFEKNMDSSELLDNVMQEYISVQ